MKRLNTLNAICRFGTGLIVLLAFLLSGCGGGDNSDSSSSNNDGAGWVRINSAWSDSQNAYLGGTAFISPTWFFCCTGSPEDTGVIVSWSNSTAGIYGAASQDISYYCFIYYCGIDEHFWSATIPINSGANQIAIIASDPSSNIGRAYFTISPNTIYPNVLSTDPLDFTQGIDINTSISATFNDNIDPASVNSTTFKFDENVTGTFNVIGETVTFVPSVALVPHSLYHISITTGVKNLQGNSLLEQYRWSFETATLP
jgi:hypothetical protein